MTRAWDSRIEEMPPEDIKKLQYKLLKTLVYKLYSFSPFYHRRMEENNVHPDDIKTIGDIQKLPFMYKKTFGTITLTRSSSHPKKNWSGTMSPRERRESPRSLVTQRGTSRTGPSRWHVLWSRAALDGAMSSR